MSLRYKGGLISPSVNPLAANITTSPNVAQYNGVFTLQQQAQALTSGQWATDPYYKNTTLLLHADGKANGSQNNTFLDSSLNSFTITRSGIATQGAFTPYGGPNWSNYFGGGSLLTVPAGSAFAYGTGAFTVEAWLNPYTYQAGVYGGGAVFTQATGGQNYFLFAISATGAAELTYGGGGGTLISTAAGVIPLNTWTHVALVREGTSSNQFKIYVNGVLATTNTVATDFSNTSYTPGIGSYSHDTSSIPYGGYISNLRVVKGVAVYTGTFTPPTNPLTATQSAGTNIAAITGSQTSLLTCQSSRFADNSVANSGSGWTVGSNGGPSVQRFNLLPTQYQYTPAGIGGSGYFNGSGSYLTIADATPLNLSGGTYTIEGWINPNGDYSNYRTIVSKRVGGGSASCAWGVYLRASSGVFSFYNGTNYESAVTPQAKAWSYFAAVYDGTNINLYLNGVRVLQSSMTNSDVSASVYIGSYPGYSEDFPGYISNLRITKGGALYSGTTMAIPTTPLTTTVGSGTVSLLTNFTNAGIYDNAMMNDLETVGNAQVSTSVVKYGSGSLYFGGTGDYLVFQSNPAYAFGTGDFTIECWVNEAVFGSGSDQGIFQISTTAGGFQTTNSNTIALASWNSSGKGFRIYANATSGESGFIANTGTWYHLAVVRSSSITKLYMNGTAIATVSSDTTNYTGTYLVVGGYYSTSYLLNGYIDDLRITKGVARYTANFIPPKVAFANQ